jgi:hypothetical protein
MTAELSGWFSDLATVEYELRRDIRRYDMDQVTPLQLGARILEHPSMLVTSRLKQRFASTIVVEQSYSDKIVQTVKFPFRRPDDLAVLLEENLLATRRFLAAMGPTDAWLDSGPLWRDKLAEEVLAFLTEYKVDDQARSISLPLLRRYIEQQLLGGQLVKWTVAVKGRTTHESALGQANWGVQGGTINMISRSRLRSDPDSLGVLTSPDDETTGFNDEQMARARQLRQSEDIGLNPAARRVRAPSNGLILLYPISRFSRPDSEPSKGRQAVFEDPRDATARDIVGLAISFPRSTNAQPVRGYSVGTVGWAPE